MLEVPQVINHIFEECVTTHSIEGTFDTDAILKNLDTPEAANDNERYIQKLNVANALNFLEKNKLISHTMKIEFTENLRLPLEKPQGRITKFGQFVRLMPKPARIALIAILNIKRHILAWLGVLSFLKLSYNAYTGAIIASSWVEYIAAAIVAYILYLFSLKILS
ncbi:MAG: hypothetical protein MRY32_01145 [Rickettsiales bacterium]|nr:hypothetical protein [Rickettsiales bacterium]